MKTKESSEQYARRLILQGYSDQFINMVHRCAIWLIWYVPVSGSVCEILNSGTVFFADLGSGPFGITAAHVIEGLVHDKQSHSDIICEIGWLRIDPSDRLIDLRPSFDLATFRITRDELDRLELAAHVSPSPWPPLSPLEGKGAFFGGFRLGGSKQLDSGNGPYPVDFWNGFGPLSGVYDRQIKMNFEREHWIHRSNQLEPAPGAKWGGISGGPLFALFENPVVYYQLVGVISEYSETLEILVATPALFISSDGTIHA